METRTFQSNDGIPIAYYVIGAENAETMILSNGLGGNVHAWQHLIDFFAPHYRILTWDYRGLYNSGRALDRDHYAMEYHVDDLRKLMEIEQVQHPILLGWSMGVQLNFEHCRNAPPQTMPKAICAINGTFGRPFSTARGVRHFESQLPIVFDLIRKYWEPAAALGSPLAELGLLPKLMSMVGLMSDTVDLEICNRLVRGFASLDFGVYTQILEQLGEHDAYPVLPGLKVPTLVIAGDRDLMTPEPVAAQTAKTLPDAELFVIHTGTHYAPVEFPELVNLRIEKFLHERFGEVLKAANG